MKVLMWVLGLFGETKSKIISNVVVIVMVASGCVYMTNKAYNNGVTVTALKYEKAQSEAIEIAMSEAKAKNKANQTIAQAYWENELSKKPKIKTIEKRIIEYVEIQIASDSDECLLDDGELFIIQDLVSIANSAKDTDRYGANATVQQDKPTNQAN